MRAKTAGGLAGCGLWIIMNFQMALFSTPSVTSSPALQIPESKTSQFTFDNGLTLIVREDRSAPVVSVQAWCRTGSIHEDKWIGAGLSHILEHMLFKGTQTRGLSEIAQTVQGVGGYMNAYTSFDRTVFYVDAPSSGWKTLLDILTDAIFHSTLPEGEYAKEQEVIRREFAMGFDSPERMASELMFETAYHEHPYRYPVIGYLDIYNRLTRQDVLDYYHARYAPNNLTFIIVGDVSFSEIKKHLEPLVKQEKRRVCKEIFIPKEPEQLGRREQHQEFNTSLTQLRLCYHIPSITHPDVYALDLLSVVLGQGRSSRLDQEILEKRALVHSIGAFSFTPGEAGLFAISAVCNAEKREEAQNAILDEIEKIKNAPISALELEKARKQTLASHLNQLQTMAGQAADIGSSWFVANDLNFSENYLKKIQAVTAEDIQRVAKTYFNDDNLTLVSLNPKGSLSPAAHVVSATNEVASLSIETHQLSNGIPVIIGENDRLPLASVRISFKSGALFENPTNQGITHLTTQSLLKGTKNRTTEQIANELENLGGSIDVDSGFNTTSLQVDVLKSDLNQGIALASDVLLHSQFPEEEVKKEKLLQLAALQQEKTSPWQFVVIF
ncbi:MAG: insulinase family protein [Verrucomicrobiia bacterium]